MAVPKKKTTRARRNKRRLSHIKSPLRLAPCLQCRKKIPPHIACPYCGFYRGREILDLEAKEQKKRKKQKKKAQRT